MPDSSPTVVAPSSLSTTWQRNAAIAVWIASAVVLLLGYLAFAAPGPWLEAPPVLEWKAGELSASRGSAQETPSGLLVTATDAAHTAVIALSTSFRARDYPAIAWDATGVPDSVQVTLLWYSDINSTRVFRRPLTVESGRIAPVILTQDPGWLGRIGGLALVIEGDLEQPVLLGGAAAKPMSALQVLGDRIHEWLVFEPWTGASINGLGARGAQELPLPFMLALVTGLAVVLYVGLAWRKLRRFSPTLAVAIAGMVMAAWAIADVRWQWNLVRQTRATLAQYGGKSVDERHLAAEDGPLFAFIDKVRQKLPAPPARIFMAADLPYFRARGAYHLYPYNVYYDPGSTALPKPESIHRGDFIVVYQRHGVQYDPSSQRLRWDDQTPLNAELLLVESGSALFRIR